MTPKDFCLEHRACREGERFASQFQTMHEVWEKCERPDWLFWILEKHVPLEKEQSVRLAITFAETALQFSSNKERDDAVIQTARNWLENPTEENRLAAAARWAAADADARWADAHWAAARWAAADADARWAAAAAARWAVAARWADADADAARKEQCEMIRGAVKNPFEN